MRTIFSHPASQFVAVLVGGILLSAISGCGNSATEAEKARQREAEMAKRLQECETQLAEARKALEAARRGSRESVADARWQAARLAADLFLDAVNSRNADAANTVGTKGFQEKNGGRKAIEVFSGGRFRGEASGYKCARLTNLEAVPGQDEFIGRGQLHYRDVPRQDSTYTLRLVKEGEKWRVASFTAVAR
ncbi:MAG TPA: hypothetical protein VH682_09330 [Gemmataceae bacterium]|jgi:hypothetical protein